MSDLLVVIFDDEFKAEKVRLDLLQMQHEHLIDLEDAAVVVRNSKGYVRLHHVSHMTMPTALTGGFVGLLSGLILFNPILAVMGLVGGSAFGAVLGTLKEVGIDEKFINQLASHLKPASSALFILIKKGKPEAIKEEAKRFNGKVLQASLAHEDINKLQKGIDAINQASNSK